MAEKGNVKVALGVLVFSVFSFFITFGVVWMAVIGPNNPFVDKGAKVTAAEMARADSLRAVEMALQQKIRRLEREQSKLNKSADSLITEIDSYNQIVQQLEDELSRLGNQVGGEGQQRMEKLSSIVSALSEKNLKRITEDLDVNTLVSLIMNSSNRRARTIMNAMDPKRAAVVAKALSRVKDSKGG